MSGLIYPGNSIKSAVFRRVRPRLFTSVHGVSVVILWSLFASNLKSHVNSQKPFHYGHF